MKKVLTITKPLEKPLNDATKTLAFSLMANLPQRRFHALTPMHSSLGLPNVKEDAIYAKAGSFQPALAQNLSVFMRLVKPDELGIYHFFFQPNPLSSFAARLALNMKGAQPSIQTVTSAPADFNKAGKLLFGDIVVTVSEWTRKQLIEAAPKADVRCILPGRKLDALPTKAEISETRKRLGLPERKCLALYPGDLEFSRVGEFIIEALKLIEGAERLALVFSMRRKTARFDAALSAFQAAAKAASLQERVMILPERKDFQTLVRSVDFLLMPPDSLFAKMDIPLALLDGFACGKPAIVSDLPSLIEAVGEGEEAGLVVSKDSPKAFAEALGRMAEQDGLLRLKREGAQARLEEKFSLAKMAAHYDALYQTFD